MGVRAAVVVCVTSFLIGALSVNWIADSLTLWESPLTEAHLRAAAGYYTLLSKTPPAASYSLLGVVAFGAVAILTSVYDGRAGNLMFDGASLFLYACAAIVYLFSVVPNLEPFISLPTTALNASSTFPADLKRPTLELGASHLVCSVALTGVMLLQAGRQYAESEDDAPSPEPAPPASRRHSDPEPPSPTPSLRKKLTTHARRVVRRLHSPPR